MTGLLASLWLAGAVSAAPDDGARLARDIYAELVAIDTSDPGGDTTAAADAVARRLRAAGFPDDDLQLIVPHERKGNLVARLRGSGRRRPLLLLAHLDVVAARREDWSREPFRLQEQDGFFYGRGTSDDKAMAAIFVESLIRLKHEGYRPARDLVLALTADEETGGDWNGAQFLLREHRALVDAEYGLNEGGFGQLKAGVRLANTVQTSEKVYMSFRLEVKNPGGHSSLPRKDNAIYALGAALGRVAAFSFPVRMTDAMRVHFERMAGRLPAPLAQGMLASARVPPDLAALEALSELPLYNAMLRTTCVATRLEAGHADNALPQTARATVNCRIHPSDSADWVQAKLAETVADPQVTITRVDRLQLGPPSPLESEVFEAIEKVTRGMWPGVPVVPFMSPGATDSIYFRAAGIPMYGVSGMFQDVDDIRMHGQDERLLVSSFDEGREFLYRLVKTLSAPRVN